MGLGAEAGGVPCLGGKTGLLVPELINCQEAVCGA